MTNSSFKFFVSVAESLGMDIDCKFAFTMLVKIANIASSTDLFTLFFFIGLAESLGMDT